MSMDVLQAKIRLKKNPVAVALDLQPDFIPPFILAQSQELYGVSLQALAEAYFVFGAAILDILVEIVPAVKMPTGCFEALGADGIMTMSRLCAYGKKLGYYMIMETMRADAEPVAGLLAQTYLAETAHDGQSPGPYQADAVSLCAFLGSDGIRPYVPYCKQGKSLFVLAKSPNQSAREVQDLLSGDRVVYTVMADLAMRWGGELLGKNGYAQLGLGVGATQPEALRQLRSKYDRLFFLVSGYGQSGGEAKDVQYAFDQFGHGAVAAAGECLLTAWKKDSDNQDFGQQIYAAAVKLCTELSVFVTVM